MALHPDFPTDPHAVLDPSVRWFPADEALREVAANRLTPPLVAELRKKVQAFRDSGYEGASETSRALLHWWFVEEHLIAPHDGPSFRFKYYFAQREAIETIVWLTDVAKVQDPADLLRYDATGEVSRKMFDEDWRRYMVKMATGSGKTKVLSLVLAWSFFSKTYEADSPLARNFLVIAPNIIVLDRIRKDFEGLTIFFQDPVLPENGFRGRNWRDDFQLTLHVQDDVRVRQPTGNIFLTNIHRVYDGADVEATAEDEDTMDYFFGKRPTGATNDSKVDLGEVVRDIDELAVLNDEAHHVHDKKLAWFKSIQDIHNQLVQKGGVLSLQVDVTATPKHENGAIFAQTVSDYPLVEAIAQDVVKHPVLPDAASRDKLEEHQTTRFTDRYADFLELGVLEWRKAAAEHAKARKKAILFVMTNDTKNCDEVAAWLERHNPDLADAVLTIHTKKTGEVSEASSGKAADELADLRRQANGIDRADSPFKAIVSVLMLKEGWDVKNVTTIVGLRAYSGKNKVLPEQTLGRGLRKMYGGGLEERVSVVGTPDFMEFIEGIQQDGVELERSAMGTGTPPAAPLVVEVDTEDESKDIDALDIEMPVLAPRYRREYHNLGDLDPATVPIHPVTYQRFSAEEQREIVFKDMATGGVTHTTRLDGAGVADHRRVLAWFTQRLLTDLRLVSGFDVLYGKVKAVVRDRLFGGTIDLEDPNTPRNLSEPAATKSLLDAMTKGINELTVQESGDAEIRDTIKLRTTRPFMVKSQDFVAAKKSVFNRTIGDSGLELRFAEWLDGCADVASFAKVYLAVPFTLDYVKADGDLSTYRPDFFVKLTDGKRYVVETKGLEDVDVAPKMARLKQWCEDVGHASPPWEVGFVYVDEDGFDEHRPKSFAGLVEGFREFQD
ncbi:DEAD/DEAH box helicase [Phycisphaera mikurensis]|uniref:Putative restriction endonuclease n=1 Tax=Phycisphaera mikurensis (strain NBRC 102666 / KCTC 22515 / FYK2301M01) TaxID=1142394 RepID=I0IJ62_PHYMF|nr:DEAD/DEAH box helicase family protein [Phycisphaera mikurensis]MBB6443273.1 type III restriction enzyme [Phycisphaera mikurensis]BAM05300.1 putative restriction endonuclease [Phycisphaera mikurensis NBRC 102666]